MANELHSPQPPAYTAGKLCRLTKQAAEAFVFDLVAVHGLQVAAYRTDTWLTHLLPKRFPGSRVFSFRYSTPNVFAARWEAGFEQTISKLLDGIVTARDPLTAQRPLVFMCQGLGGLLVEAALNRVMADDPRYSQLKMATKAVIFLNTPQNQTNMAPWTPLLTRMAAPSLPAEPLLLRDVEKWLQSNASSLQKVALLFKERCSKLRILSIYNSVSAVQLGSGDELTSVFATGFKREKTLDIKGYDYHSTPKPASDNDELLQLLTKEVKWQLRVASKLDNPAATGPDAKKQSVPEGKAGTIVSQPDSRPASNVVSSQGRDKQLVSKPNEVDIPSAKGQKTSLQRRPLGRPGSSRAPDQTASDTKKTNVTDGKRSNLASQPDGRPAPNVVAPRVPEKQGINNEVIRLVSVQNQQTFQNQQVGSGPGLAPTRTGPVPKSGASSKPIIDRRQPEIRPTWDVVSSRSRDGQFAHNKGTSIASGQCLQTYFQNPYGPGSGKAPSRTGPALTQGGSSKPPVERPQPGSNWPDHANRQFLPGNNSARPIKAYSPPPMPGPQQAYSHPQASGMPSQRSAAPGNTMYTGPSTQQPASQRSGPNPYPQQRRLPYRPSSSQLSPGNVAGNGPGQGYPGRAEQATSNRGFNGQPQRQQPAQQQETNTNPKSSGFFRKLFGSEPTSARQQPTRGMPPDRLNRPPPPPSQQQPRRGVPPRYPSQPSQHQPTRSIPPHQHSTRGMPPNHSSQPPPPPPQQQQCSNSAYSGNSQSSRNTTPQYGQDISTPSSRGPTSAAAATTAMQSSMAPSFQQPSHSFDNSGVAYSQPEQPGASNGYLQSFSPQNNQQPSHPFNTFGPAYPQPQQSGVSSGLPAQSGFPGSNLYNTSHPHEEHYTAHYHNQGSTGNANSSSTTDNTKSNLKAAGGGFVLGSMLGAGGKAVYDHFHDKYEDKSKQDQQTHGLDEPHEDTRSEPSSSSEDDDKDSRQETDDASNAASEEEGQQTDLFSGPHNNDTEHEESGQSEDDDDHTHEEHYSEDGDEEEEQHHILSEPDYDDTKSEESYDVDDGDEYIRQGYAGEENESGSDSGTDSGTESGSEGEGEGEGGQYDTLDGPYHYDNGLEAFDQTERHTEYPYHPYDSEEGNTFEPANSDEEGSDTQYDDEEKYETFEDIPEPYEYNESEDESEEEEEEEEEEEQDGVWSGENEGQYTSGDDSGGEADYYGQETGDGSEYGYDGYPEEQYGFYN